MRKSKDGVYRQYETQSSEGRFKERPATYGTGKNVKKKKRPPVDYSKFDKYNPSNKRPLTREEIINDIL